MFPLCPMLTWASVSLSVKWSHSLYFNLPVLLPWGMCVCVTLSCAWRCSRCHVWQGGEGYGSLACGFLQPVSSAPNHTASPPEQV